VSFRPKDLEIAAELLGGLIYDEPFRSKVLEGQRARVRAFGPGQVEQPLREMLEIWNQDMDTWWRNETARALKRLDMPTR